MERYHTYPGAGDGKNVKVTELPSDLHSWAAISGVEASEE